MKIFLIHNKYKEAGGEDAVFYAEGKLLYKNRHFVEDLVFDNSQIKTVFDRFLSGLKLIYNPKSARKILNSMPRPSELLLFLPGTRTFKLRLMRFQYSISFAGIRTSKLFIKMIIALSSFFSILINFCGKQYPFILGGKIKRLMGFKTSKGRYQSV